jgi:hypothetical protein
MHACGTCCASLLCMHQEMQLLQRRHAACVFCGSAEQDTYHGTAALLPPVQLQPLLSCPS